MCRLDVAEGVSDPPSDSLARPLGRIEETAGTAAQTERSSQLGQKELPLFACPTRALWVIARVGITDLVIEIGEPCSILAARLGVECLSCVAFDPETKLCNGRPTARHADSVATVQIDRGDIPTRCPEELGNVAQALAVPQTRNHTLIG